MQAKRESALEGFVVNQDRRGRAVGWEMKLERCAGSRARRALSDWAMQGGVCPGVVGGVVGRASKGSQERHEG